MSENKIHIICRFLFCLALILVSGCESTGPFNANNRIKTFGHSGQTGNQSKPRLTILLAQYVQPDRIQLAQMLQQRAKTLLNTDDIWLQNDIGGLAVNYGHFYSDKEAKKYLAKVKQLYKQLQPGPWQFCFIKEIPPPDPIAPDEWNLLNSNCDFSLEIGTYFDVLENNYFDRKTDALKAVTNLRQSGEIAFLIHGQSDSRIYIECFRANDVKQIWKNGQLEILLSPHAKGIQNKCPFYYEHGAKIYGIRYDKQGKKIRIPRKSKFVDVQKLREKIPF